MDSDSRFCLNNNYSSSFNSFYYAVSKLPQHHKAKISLWKYLNANNLDSLLACFEIDDYEDFLGQLNQTELNVINDLNDKKLNLYTAPSYTNQYKIFSRLLSVHMNFNLNDKKDCILIDKYYYLIKFGLNNAFDKEKISVLVTLMKQTHDIACETSFGNLDEAFEYFKNLLLCYTVHRPPFSLKLLSPKETELIIDYFLKSYFNQFKLYKYVFTSSIKLNLKFKYSNLPQETTANQEYGNMDRTFSAREFHDESSFMENNELGTGRLDSKTPGGQDDEEDNSKDNSKLKEFVKLYLNEKLDKMKNELREANSAGSKRDATSAGNEKSKLKQKKEQGKPKSPAKKN